MALRLLLLIACLTIAEAKMPKGFVLPVSKESATKQYTTHLYQRTPLVPIKLAVHIGGKALLVNCETNFTSNSFKHVPCNSPICSSIINSFCLEKTCNQDVDNPIQRSATNCEVGQDVLELHSTDSQMVKIPNFVFSCGWDEMLNGLAKGVTGIAGLGRNRFALPTQISSAFKLKSKFSLCLTSQNPNGFIVFGADVIPPNDPAMRYTPLLINAAEPRSIFSPYAEYFIGVTSVKVNGHEVNFNRTLLSIDSHGNGGTKLSTLNAYTVLETSIYKAVESAFVTSLGKARRVTPVAPFTACFDGRDIGSVPGIQFALQNKKIIFIGKPMVQVSYFGYCFAFVDAGVDPKPTTSIVLGGYQLENHLLVFDLEASRLGMLQYPVSCTEFNSTLHI